MIKITRFFYLNWLVFPLFLGAYFAGVLKTLMLSYCIVAVHELFHLFAAILLHVRVKSIIMMPFGMTLRLSSSVIKSPAKEALIAACGPISNIIMAACGFFLMKIYTAENPSLVFFTALNIIIAALNLLPALPLDGGRILRSVLVERIGFLGAVSVTKKFTRAVAVFICLLGVAVFLLTKMNLSLILVGSFILISMISDEKNNEYIIMKDILYSGSKIKESDMMRAKLMAAGENVPLGELIKRFDYSSFHLIGIIDERKRVKRIVSECEIVDAVTKNNSAFPVGKI